MALSETNAERSPMLDTLVKMSGDLVDNERFYNWLSTIDIASGRLFIICGGGSAITTTLNENKIPFDFRPLGREIYTQDGQRLAKKNLEEQKALLEEKLQENGIIATVLMPVSVVPIVVVEEEEHEDKILHMNGDIYMFGLYPNFGKIYWVTVEGRPKEIPENLTRIEVVYI